LLGAVQVAQQEPFLGLVVEPVASLILQARTCLLGLRQSLLVRAVVVELVVPQLMLRVDRRGGPQFLVTCILLWVEVTVAETVGEMTEI
jgi:hypothetical protein